MTVDEPYTGVPVPTACRAIYDADDLVAVCPHTDSEGLTTLEDGLQLLESALGTDDDEPSGGRRRAATLDRS